MPDKYEEVLTLSRKRGFIWPSFELYEGLSGFFDYGPLGTALKRKIENLWRNYFIRMEGFFEIETPTITLDEVFIGSGHVQQFKDPMARCNDCGEVFKADHLVKDHVSAPDSLDNKELSDVIEAENIRCLECGGILGEVFDFNLMFHTTIGTKGEGKVGYLRPELAQGMFIDFPRLSRFYRGKLPFGVTQIGKAYRNEISPRQGVIRLRELTLAEIEVFLEPDNDKYPGYEAIKDEMLLLLPKKVQEDSNNPEPSEMTIQEAINKGIVLNEVMGYFMTRTRDFLVQSGIKGDRLRFRQHLDTEKAHYSKDCWDAEFDSQRFGWIEIVGISFRGDYDLKSHARHSEKVLGIFRSFDHPRVIMSKMLKPNFKVIGQSFQDKAPKIFKALEHLDPENIAFDDGIDLETGGEVFHLEKGMVTIESVEEKITGETIIPHILEPSFGIDRILYSILESCYDKELVDGKERTVLRFPSSIAPIDAAVLPLIKDEGLIKKSKEITQKLKKMGLLVEYDEVGAIGRRYRRMDEAGTPFDITVDFQTMDDSTVTLRDRDSMKQVRVPDKELEEILKKLLSGEGKNQLGF